jgi:hypothetical protein
MYGVLRLSYAETSNAVNELPFEEGSISDRAAGTGTEPKGLGHGEFLSRLSVGWGWWQIFKKQTLNLNKRY